MRTLQRIFYGALISFAVLLLAIVFAANSSFVIQKAAERFAPDYEISYRSITGNILTGVSISGVKFKGEPLVEGLNFSWDPSRLLYKSITIHKINIDALNVDTAKHLAAAFIQEDNSSSGPFGFTVSAGRVHLSVDPFLEQGIFVSKTLLDAKEIQYAGERLQIGNFTLLADSNISRIDAEGSLTGDTLSFEHLVWTDIDTLAVQKLFFNENNGSGRTVSAEQNRTEQSKDASPLPKTVILKSFHADVLPAVYDPVHVLRLVLDARDLRFDAETLLIEKGSVDLNGTTNLSNFRHSGKIRNNRLSGRIDLTPNKKLFELYDLPLRKEAIGDIMVDFNASKERISADIRAKAKHVLISKNGEFNLDVNSILSHVVYDIRKNILTADSDMLITTPYAKDISVTNIFTMDGEISYRGEIKAKELIGIDAKFTKPLKNLKIRYSGDSMKAGIVMAADGVKGTFDSADLKKGQLHLETTKAISVNEMVSLPAELNGSKVNVTFDAPLDFKRITPVKAKVKILSNIADIDADIVYGKTLGIKAIAHLPDNSLLRSWNENIRWDALDPLRINALLAESNVTLELGSEVLSSKMKYILGKGKVDGEIKLAGLVTKVKGVARKKITVNAHVDSMKSLSDSVRSFYMVENIPPLEGSLDLSVDITALKQADITLTSPKVIYKADRKTEHLINDVKVVISLEREKVWLKAYKATYNKMKFFSTKPSLVNLKADTVEISPFWLNDQLKVVGTYDLKKKKGEMSAEASSLHVAHEWVDLDSAVSLNTELDGNQTSVKGELTLLGGDIHYDLRQKTFASDSDIIIVQDRKKVKESSPFTDNLSISVKVRTKKPLVYRQGDVNIQAKVDLGIEKAAGTAVLVLGMVELPAGGSYIFQDKKFVLKRSSVYFTGDINQPILDIKAEYKTVKYLISVSVTGTPDLPNINFSSVPYLTREQILSVILFDSEAGAESNSGEDMMKMMGGAMAKSALSNVGIKLDHLVLGAGNSVEVGKKLTDKITIIYINDEVSSVKLKYDYSRNIEGVITISPESSSGDIFYKGDF